jgi:hypothetical protein
MMTFKSCFYTQIPSGNTCRNDALEYKYMHLDVAFNFSCIYYQYHPTITTEALFYD